MPNDTHGHYKSEIWSQKCQESGNREPASQHTFQQRNLNNKNQTTKTCQTSKPSNQSEPKVLKQCVTQGLERGSCKYQKGGMGTNIQKPTSQQTLQQRVLAKQKPDSKTQQASKPIRILPSHHIQKPTSQQTLQQRVLAKQKPDSKTQQASKPIIIVPGHQASNHEACDCQGGRRQGRSLKIIRN